MLGSGTVQPGHPIYQQAVQLGEALAKNGFMVCHGGYGGVMEAVARGVKEADGRNVGITIRPKTKSDFKSGQSPTSIQINPWVDTEIRMLSWEKRLFKLIEMGDAYVFLDGATGTFNELFFVWEMANKKLHAKPIILLGKRLHWLVRFLKRDSSLKVPKNFYIAASISHAVELLKEYL